MTERCYQGPVTIDIPFANRPISRPSRGSIVCQVRERWHVRGAARHVFQSNVTSRRRTIQDLANALRSSGSLAPPITTHQSLITSASLRHGVRRNRAALDHASLSGPDPAPIFQGQQTDTHNDELARDKG